MRCGGDYLASLNDGRAVYVDGERVLKVAEHAAFRGIGKSVASLYDAARDPGRGMSYTSPETGTHANRSFMIPRSREELTGRRQALTNCANISNGLIGRGPEHVAGFLSGFASGASVFARAGEQFGANVERFHRMAASEDLYVTYVIVPPQVDRSKTANEQEEQFLQVGVCSERDDGIVVRGAQMLGTATAVSDYLLVSCIVPLGPGD
jgi:4-hydroxyphenylacetate 3-monooxygenase